MNDFVQKLGQSETNQTPRCFQANYSSSVLLQEKSMDLKMKSSSLVGINFLRAVSALLVFFFHRSIWQDKVLDLPTLTAVQYKMFHYGALFGVTTFFVISALLFTHKLLAGVGFEPVAFLINRFFRIAPLCWVVVVFVLIYSNIESGVIPTLNLDFLKRLLLWCLGGFRDGPTPLVEPMPWWPYVAGNWWTLRHEWLLYSVIPVCAVMFRRTKYPLLCVVTGGALIAAMKGLPAILSNPVNFAFVGGIILAICYHFGYNKVHWFILLVASAVSLIFGLKFETHWPFILPSIAVTYYVIHGQVGDKVINHKLVTFVGESSYSIYLLHGIVILLSIPFISRLSPNQYSVFCVIQFAILIVLSNLTYRTIELPGIKLGRTLTKTISRSRTNVIESEDAS